MFFPWAVSTPFSSARMNLTGLAHLTDGGSANAYTASPTPALAAYAAGMAFTFIPANTNTGASTFNLNSLGVKDIVNMDGSPLLANQIISGVPAMLIYDGTQFRLFIAANDKPIVSRVTGVSVSGTGAYEDLASYTIPAGKLGTDRGIRLRAYVKSSESRSGGSVSTGDLRVVFGATTIFTFSLLMPNTFSGGDPNITEVCIDIFNNASASSQEIMWKITESIIEDITGSPNTASFADNTTSTENTGSAVELLVEAQRTAPGSGSSSVELLWATYEII